MFMHLLWCDSTCMPCCQNWPSFSSVSMSRRHSMRLLMIEKKCTWLHVEFTWVGHISLFIYYISIYIYTTFLPMELKVADSTRGLAACVARPLHWVSVDARIPAALFFASADRSACFLALTLSWPASAAWLIFLVFAVQIAKFMKWWIKIMQARRMQRVYSCLTDQVFFPDQHCSNISYIY